MSIRNHRRLALKVLAAGAAGPVPSFALSADTTKREVREKDEWMNGWMQNKGIRGRLEMSRFVEPIYFLLRETEWETDHKRPGLPTVRVPKGFVTDLASIPRPFWTLLRPDDTYAHAAVIHDYLYWTQEQPRAVADEIFRAAMEFLDVPSTQIFTIFTAVRSFGDKPWDENRLLRAQGEKRILNRFPEKVNESWSVWKKLPDTLRS